MVESQLISKVLDDGKFHELQKHNIQAEDFPTLGEVYEFIRQYVSGNAF